MNKTHDTIIEEGKAKLEARKLFAKNIPMDEFYDYLRNLTGIATLEFTSEVKVNYFDTVSINYKSSSLMDHVGIYKLSFKECIIEDFGARVEYSDEVNPETGERYKKYWTTVDLIYQHLGGGRNGTTIAYASYHERDGWEFQSSVELARIEDERRARRDKELGINE